MQSHPLTRDRLRAAEEFVAAQTQSFAPNPTQDYWFARLRGKLSAFIRAPNWTLLRAKDETYDDIRLMREAVAYHRLNQLPRAVATIDQAIALRPEDGYYYSYNFV